MQARGTVFVSGNIAAPAFLGDNPTAVFRRRVSPALAVTDSETAALPSPAAAGLGGAVKPFLTTAAGIGVPEAC